MRTDSRGGAFWELLVHGSDGRPLLQALEQRFNDNLDRDERPLLDIGRTMIELYPARLESWSTLRAAESALIDEGAEERREVHRDQARVLDRRLSQQSHPNPNQMGYLFSYASLLRDTSIAERWRDRLAAMHPGHYFAVVDRVYELRRMAGAQSAAALREFERLWGIADTEARSRLIAGAAFTAARQTANTATILLWADRHVALDPSRRSSIARALAATEVTREEGIQRLRDEIARLDPLPDWERPLGMTRPEFTRAIAERRAALQTDVARALIASGRGRDAVAMLDSATMVGWDIRRLQSLGEARLSSGDTLGALNSFALAAADPVTAITKADSLRRALGVTAELWERSVSRARSDMIAKTMDAARTETLPAIHLDDSDGVRSRLESLLGENGTVLVFWSPFCRFSHEAMPEIVALAEQLDRQGIPLLAISRDAPAAAEEYLRKNGWNLQVRYDASGEAARSLNNWATPQYYVLDSAGRVRFAMTDRVDIRRQLLALRMHASVP